MARAPASCTANTPITIRDRKKNRISACHRLDVGQVVVAMPGIGRQRLFERLAAAVLGVSDKPPPQGGGSGNGLKALFRPEAGKMGPAPSGLQEVDGLNHLL